MLASRLRLNHTVVPVGTAMVLADLDAIVRRMGQPTVDGVNSWVISRAVREAGLVVALSGLGGDELFRGYPRSATRLGSPDWAGVARHVPGPVGAPAYARWPTLAGPRAGARRRGRPARRRPRRVRGGAGPVLGARPGTPVAGHPVGAGPRRRHAPRRVPAARHRAGDRAGAVQLPAVPAAAGHRRDEHGARPGGPRPAAGRAGGRRGVAPAACGARAVRQGGSRRGRGPAPGAAARRPKRTFTLPFDAWLRGALRDRARDAVVGLADAGLGLDRAALAQVWRRFECGRLAWRPLWALAVLGEWVAAARRSKVAV